MLYAFQVFAAIYGYRYENANPGAATLRCIYGDAAERGTSPYALYIPALYRARDERDHSADGQTIRYAGESMFLFFGTDTATERPDWLGEIFEWLSSSYEANSTVRDSAGRIPYSASVMSQRGLSPRKPYANMIMAWLQNALVGRISHEALPAAPSPIPGAAHLVVCSHDIDFYRSNRRATLVRLFKNLAVAGLLYRSWPFFWSNLARIPAAMGGRRAGDFLPALFAAGKEHNFQSTLFVVARHSHRRDPDYSLEDLAARLKEATAAGFTVDLHGTYLSIIENSDLAAEAETLEQCTGTKVRGGRQHWLRFDRHQKLFECIERAGFAFDSSLGFSDVAGFRSAASFAFPPYDFGNERPHAFLEIPLVIMDGNLEATARVTREDPLKIANEILAESRKYGWGGVSVLWHNPMETLSVPRDINNVFWQCLQNKAQFDERWITAEQLLSASIHRYHDAGLLKGISADA
jgi:peptidoglycan/xylan/chitin deacetylase (PgdA/CDA1 family)